MIGFAGTDLNLSTFTNNYQIGVYGSVPTTVTNGYAGYFQGNVKVTDNLTAGSKNFKIDHPLDPANKYLYHTSVESPDMMNIYNGLVALDDQGEATVEMPDWFEALNTDFRYQLTAIGGASPNLHIAEKLTNHPFKIASGQPGQEISWQVTGIRQDAFGKVNRSPVEQDKPADDKGTYLHPALFGQPEEMSVHYHPPKTASVK